MPSKKPPTCCPRTMAQFGSDKRDTYLAHLRGGARRMSAAEAVGVAYSTVWRAMQSDTEFQTAVNHAEMRANELVEDALFRAAIDGNVTAQQVWLYNRAPEDWRDMRGSASALAVQTSPGGPNAHNPQDSVKETAAESKPANPERVVELSRCVRESG